MDDVPDELRQIREDRKRIAYRLGGLVWQATQLVERFERLPPETQRALLDLACPRCQGAETIRDASPFNRARTLQRLYRRCKACGTRYKVGVRPIETKSSHHA